MTPATTSRACAVCAGKGGAANPLRRVDDVLLEARPHLARWTHGRLICKTCVERCRGPKLAEGFWGQAD